MDNNTLLSLIKFDTSFLHCFLCYLQVKKIINTRRGSLKKEFRKKEYEPCNSLNKKRNSTGSVLGDAKHAHKISNSSNRKVSTSIRADSTEDRKLSLGVRR